MFDIQKQSFTYFDKVEPNIFTHNDALEKDMMCMFETSYGVKVPSNIPRQTIKETEIDVLELHNKEDNCILITADDVDLFKKYFDSLKN